MINNITLSLQRLDPRYHIVKKVLVGNLNVKFIKKNRTDLRNQSFIFIGAPHRVRVCSIPDCNVIVQESTNKRYPYERQYDVVDRIILGEILNHILGNELSPNILLASSYSDFTLPLQLLR
ncbi:PREDICTED: uncharacterized protein LOC104703544 [Camelina sativa]|uniref:Uncharacterized protein LOC104703544 n=1 Tax=Camelina sativa TaxID=90675 RepID=A0ABM0SY96_CAMSA|nr:PREDICTED: uncharacterized protein LOC104703544 [Camelina sativa]